MVVVPSRMGRLNKRALLARLQQLGKASRADLAKSLGMSQPTAGKIADDLLKLGVLEEIDDEEEASAGAEESPTAAPARLGRPGRMLRLNRRTARFIGIQLGVNETKLAALPVGAEPEDHWTVAFKTPNSAEEWEKGLRAAAEKMRSKNVWGVLVSVPGIVDEKTGRVLFSPNLHWTEQAKIGKLLERVWQAPTRLVQEERALALGHQFVEAEEEGFLLVDFGAGVGGAVILEGKLYANPLPLSGELGHTPVRGNQRACGCGGVGCVETLVSRKGLAQSLAENRGKGGVGWADLVDHISARGVEPWLASTLEDTAVVISGALNVLGLRRVVVTGTLVELPPAVMKCLSAAVVKGSMWARFGEVRIQSAPRRRTAGLVAVGIDRLVLPMSAHVRGEQDAANSEAL